MSVEGMRVFFPILRRQGDYSCKADGSYHSYATYREHVAIDCQRRCVYCDAKEDEVGGKEAMQLDHFRPTSFPEFEHLKNDPRNLHYACARCNLWKSSKWPARGTAHTHDGIDGFVDPFMEDRLKYFSVKSNGQIEPLLPPAKYIVGVLNLNREYLRKLREKRLLLAEFRLCREAIKAELETAIASGCLVDPTRMLDCLHTYDQIDALLG